MLLAQVIGGWSVAHLAIAIVIIAAIAALVAIALKVFQISIPWWASAAFWVVIVCVVICFAIKLVAGMF